MAAGADSEEVAVVPAAGPVEVVAASAAEVAEVAPAALPAEGRLPDAADLPGQALLQVVAASHLHLRTPNATPVLSLLSTIRLAGWSRGRRWGADHTV